MGRDRELALLGEALRGALRGSGSVVVISGEAGIGKTRLAREAVTRAAALGFRTTAQELTALNRRIAVETLRPTSPGPHIALLDDLHWAGGRTLRQVYALANEVEGRQRILLLTARRGRGHRLLPELVEHLKPSAVMLSLSRLDADESRRLVRTIAPRPLASEDELLGRADGLPLYLVAGVEDAAQGEQANSGPPSRIRDFVAREMRFLDPTEQELVRGLALAGHPVSLQIVASALALPETDVSSSLGRLVEALLVERTTGTEGEDLFAPAHPLWREVLERTVFRHDQRRLHRAFGAAISKLTPDDVVALALHELAAPGVLDPAAAPATLTEAGRRAIRDGRFPEAVAFLTAATIDPGSAQPSAEAYELLGLAQLRTGADAAAEAAWRRALELAQEDWQRAESVRYHLSLLDWERGASAAPLTDEIPDPELAPERDRLERSLHLMVWSTRFGDLEETRAALRDLLGAAKTSEAPWAHAAEEAAMANLAGFEGEIIKARAHARRAAQLAADTHPLLAMVAARTASRLSFLSGHLDDAIQSARDQIGRALTSGSPAEECSTRTWLALLLYFTGDFDSVVNEARQTRAVAEQAHALRFSASADLLTALVAAERRQIPVAQGLLGDVESSYHGGLERDRAAVSLVHAVRSVAALGSGRPEEVVDPPSSTRHPFTPTMCLGSLLTARAAAALLQPGRAEAQAVALRSAAHDSPVLAALADRVDGLAALARMDAAGAAAPLQRSALRLERLGMPLLAAEARCEWLEALGSSETTEEARDAVRDCLEVFDAQGVTPWSDRARRAARSLGMSTARRRSERSPLTPRETEVAGLVADGLSNAEIAQRLYLSERTVETHMRNIYAALGTGSRLQVSRWVEERRVHNT